MIFFLAVNFFVFFILLSLIRCILGPTSADRVVALDIINTFVVLIMLLLGVVYRSVLYTDIAIVYALLSFIGTIYIARFLEEK